MQQVTVKYEGAVRQVPIENPVRCWHSLRNAHEYLGQRRDSKSPHRYGWNPGGWLSELGHTDNPSSFSQCLGNMLIHVESDTKVGHNGTHFPGHHGGQLKGKWDAERLVTAMVKVRGHGDIPSYNDHLGRTHQDILALLDEAARLVEPLLPYKISRADSVMTKEEREEINAAVAEQEKKLIMLRFGRWLGEYEERGWDVFWADLRDSMGGGKKRDCVNC